MSRAHLRNRALLATYRIINEVLDIHRLICSAPNYFRYFLSLMHYLAMVRRVKHTRSAAFELFPQIHERTDVTRVDPHYFYQSYWAFKKILNVTPSKHYDVGSQIDLVKYLSVITEATFIDIRPINLPLDNLICERGSILSIPYPNNSLASVSCLHVLEHIGLGRYGDELDPLGGEKAAVELARVLAPGGRLYISTPVGAPRTCFNAHHIRTPREVVRLFPHLALLEFSIVDDNRRFVENADIDQYDTSDYACGLFMFAK